MATIRIRGIQMNVGASKNENLPKILKHIKECDGDIIVFPEMALTGRNSGFSDTRTQEAWNQIAVACRQSYMMAIVGTGTRDNGNVHNQVRIYEASGDLLGTQDKLVPTQQEREWCRPGGNLNIFEYKGVTFGCLVGNDFWVAPGFGPYPDPRLALQLREKGAQLIFHCNDSGIDQSYTQYYEANLKLRARESGCHVVTVNVAQPNAPLNVPSGVVSPDGEWLTRCPLQGEQKFSVDLDFE